MKHTDNLPTFFISDLHLYAERPGITSLFLDFLAHRVHRAQALYILGDLFEFWIGDDVINHPQFQPIMQGLQTLTASGVPTYVMHGNRDFLLGAEFENYTGCCIIPDPTLIDLYGTPVLLMHGDTLCTDDVEYQAFRKEVRNPERQREFLAKSLTERVALGRGYREQSKLSTAGKRPEIMDVTQHAVESVLEEYGVYHLIHGHTHRPGRHTFEINGVPAVRQVLGDWYEQGSVLTCTPQRWELTALSLGANQNSASCTV